MLKDELTNLTEDVIINESSLSVLNEWWLVLSARIDEYIIKYGKNPRVIPIKRKLSTLRSLRLLVRKRKAALEQEYGISTKAMVKKAEKEARAKLNAEEHSYRLTIHFMNVAERELPREEFERLKELAIISKNEYAQRFKRKSD